MHEIYLPSENNDLSSYLEHDWLKNRLQKQINIEREDWLNRKSGEPLPKVIGGIHLKIEDAKNLLQNAVSSCSPAQLVDRTPLADLPTETKESLRQAVNLAYLALGIIQPLVLELKLSLVAIEETTKRFIHAWQGDADSAIFATALSDLEEAAARFRRALLALPKEILLP